MVFFSKISFYIITITEILYPRNRLCSYMISILDNEYFLMGNQIAHTPNQILNVETYFNDLSGYDYVKKYAEKI